MKRKILLIILIISILAVGTIVYPETMKEDFLKNIWNIHKGPYVYFPKYSWYRIFYLKGDMTIRSRNHRKIGEWEEMINGINCNFDINQDGINEFSFYFNYESNSSVMVGSGEEIATNNSLKALMIRLYPLEYMDK